MSASPRRPLLTALLFAASIAVALGLGEIGARLTAPFFLFDGELVIDARPYSGHEGVPMESRDGVVMWHFPRDDRPPPRPVKEGFRIVMLGDSVLFPARIPDAEGTGRHLERLLNEHLDGGPYEVVNLAEPGFNTRQEERMLLDAGLQLVPDLVLVGVTTNDEQEFALDNGQLVEVHFLRHMRARRDGGVLNSLARVSYLYNWLWVLREGARAETPASDVDPLIEEPLRRMNAALRQRNGRLAIACFPDYESREADRLDLVRDRCRFPRIAEWADGAGVPYLDLVGAEARYRIRDIGMDNIHRSPYGHEVDAVAIFDWLVDDRVVPYRAIRSRPTPPPIERPSK